MNPLILQEDIALHEERYTIWGFKHGDVVKTESGVGIFGNYYKSAERDDLCVVYIVSNDSTDVFYKKFIEIWEQNNPFSNTAKTVVCLSSVSKIYLED